MDFIYFNFDLSIVSLFIGILNDKKKNESCTLFFTYIFLFLSSLNSNMVSKP